MRVCIILPPSQGLSLIAALGLGGIYKGYGATLASFGPFSGTWITCFTSTKVLALLSQRYGNAGVFWALIRYSIVYLLYEFKGTNTDAAARASAKAQKFTQQLASLYVVFYDRFGLSLLPFLVPKYKNLRSSVQRCTSSSTSASSLLMPHTTRLRDRTM